jgi:hypothetical protein
MLPMAPTSTLPGGRSVAAVAGARVSTATGAPSYRMWPPVTSTRAWSTPTSSGSVKWGHGVADGATRGHGARSSVSLGHGDFGNVRRNLGIAKRAERKMVWSRHR